MPSGYADYKTFWLIEVPLDTADGEARPRVATVECKNITQAEIYARQRAALWGSAVVILSGMGRTIQRPHVAATATP